MEDNFDRNQQLFGDAEPRAVHQAEDDQTDELIETDLIISSPYARTLGENEEVSSTNDEESGSVVADECMGSNECSTSMTNCTGEVYSRDDTITSQDCKPSDQGNCAVRSNARRQRRRCGGTSRRASYDHPFYTLGRQMVSIHQHQFLRGQQNSRGNFYEVQIELRVVDYINSQMTGFLQIANLTEKHPILTTFFEGEIIGPRYKFLTRKWGATQEIDQKHWTRFPPFEPYANTFHESSFDYSQLFNADAIFMRWKEQYAMPDWTVNLDEVPGATSSAPNMPDTQYTYATHHTRSEESIAGASLAGFYYICYEKSTQSIEGYYYHKNSEWFQTLRLSAVEDGIPMRMFAVT